MRNSKKKILAFVIVIIAFFAVCWFMDMALYPCTYLRNDVHTVSTEQSDVLILGTSNGKMGIKPDYLLEGTGLTGHNLAAGSEYPVDSYYLAKLAIEKQEPKTIIFEIDPGYFTSEKEKGNNYLLFLHEFPLSATKAEYMAAILNDCDFRSLLFPFYEYPIATVFARAGDSLSKKFSGDYSVDSLQNKTQAYTQNGFIEKFPVAESKFPSFEPESFSEEEVVPENKEYLDRLIELCKQKDITFIAVTMPLPDYTLEVGAENYSAAYDYFTDYFTEKGITYYNFNREQYKSYSHKASHFVDYDGHLNGDSAREFSTIFGSMLKNKGILK